MNRQARAAAPPGEDWPIPPGGGQRAGARAPRTGRPGRSHRGEALRIVLWKDRLDAETAHTPQQKDLRVPRRLSGAAPPSRHLCPQPETLEGQGGPAILRHQMALLELAEEPGLGHLFTDWTIPRETRDEPSAPGVPPRAGVQGGRAPSGGAAATAGAETQKAAQPQHGPWTVGSSHCRNTVAAPVPLRPSVLRRPTPPRPGSR